MPVLNESAIPDEALQTAVRAMRQDFASVVAQYDESKYPPAVLEGLRSLFSRPKLVQPEDISLALRWKFGHLAKANFPKSHRALAERIGQKWREQPILWSATPEETLSRWREAGEDSYITICFLLHLVAPDLWPILDQHNFRAVQHLLRAAGVSVASKRAPSNSEDLRLVRDFSHGIRLVWRRATSMQAPSEGDIDRYLMMLGKSLKSPKDKSLGESRS